MANGTVNLRGNVLLVNQLLAKLNLVLAQRRLPIELRHKFRRSNVGGRIPVAFDAPRHRQLLRLVDNFHLVNATVTGHAANPCVNMRRMIEVNKLRQIVNSLPSHTTSGFPTLTNRSQLRARLMHRRQRRHALRIRGTMAIDARRRRWHCCVSCIEDRVVAIATVHFQLASVDRMAERNRLRRLVADVQRIGIGEQAANGSCVNTTTRSHCAQ